MLDASIVVVVGILRLAASLCALEHVLCRYSMQGELERAITVGQHAKACWAVLSQSNAVPQQRSSEYSHIVLVLSLGARIPALRLPQFVYAQHSTAQT